MGSLQRHGGWWALLGIAALTTHAWWLTLDLPLTGEDYRILSRIDQDGVGFVSMFRPIANVWMHMLAAVNRPLATLGALIMLLAVLRPEVHPRTSCYLLRRVSPLCQRT